jgi:replicative DNA helicase
LNNPDIIIECEGDGLLPKHFAIYANQVIYMAIVYLFSKNTKVDALSIYNTIKDEKAKKAVDDFGGLEYIMLLQQAPKTENIKMFIQEIITCYIRRLIYTTCETLQEKILDDNKSSVDDILGYTNQEVTGIILEHTKANDVYKMGDKISERLQQRAEHPNELPGIEVGWKQFDRITKGAKPGDFIVVCAESKTGKSVTLLNWSKFIAINSKLPILWIDTEQDEEEQELRLLSILSQIPEDEIDMGLFMVNTAYGQAQDKINRLKQAQKLMKESQFFFTYMPDFTLEKVTALTRKFQLKYGIVALFFDYLKLNSAMGTSTKGDLRSDEKLTFFASGLKEMSGILKIPVFTANNENRTNWGGTEKDARSVGGSLGILQLATKLCFLRNKTDEELGVDGVAKGNQKFMIKYQRHGQSDIEINILFDKIRITQTEI